MTAIYVMLGVIIILLAEIGSILYKNTEDKK